MSPELMWIKSWVVALNEGTAVKQKLSTVYLTATILLLTCSKQNHTSLSLFD